MRPFCELVLLLLFACNTCVLFACLLMGISVYYGLCLSVCYDCVYFVCSSRAFVCYCLRRECVKACFCLHFFFLFFRVRLCLLRSFFPPCEVHDSGCRKCTPYVRQLFTRVFSPAVGEAYFCEMKYKCKRKRSKTLFVRLFVCL